MGTSRTRSGVSLLEVSVVIAIGAILIGLGVPRLAAYRANLQLQSATRTVADAFALARAEAIRTGNNQIVFLAPPGATDPGGNPIENASGDPVPLMVLDDGAPAASNCVIDGGESRMTFPAQSEVLWGASIAPSQAPGDPGASIPGNGVSFRDPNGTATTWVLFRPDGIPLGFDTGCSLGGVGTGAGAVYLTNSDRDYAVSVSALGAAKVYAWDAVQGAWRQ